MEEATALDLEQAARASASEALEQNAQSRAARAPEEFEVYTPMCLENKDLLDPSRTIPRKGAQGGLLSGRMVSGCVGG